MIPNEQTVRVEVLTRTCQSTASVLDHVNGEQLALPTPCSNWPVHELIGR